MNPPRIVVVGSINVDLVTRAARLPRPGETQRGTAFAMTLGGKGANQAIAAARLGADVTLIGCIGEDAFGAYARAELARETGLSLAGVRGVEGVATGIAAITIDNTGQNAITIVGGANDAVTAALVESHRALLDSADVLMIQGEVALEANIAAARRMRAKGGQVVFDPAPVPSGGFPAELLALATIITPNETETAALSGLTVDSAEAARDAAESLLLPQNTAVVIKMGAAGALAVTAVGALPVAPFAVAVVDTVAAGDSFNAGLAVGLARRIAWPAALRLASASGALATTRAGASSAAPQLEEVDALMSRSETSPDLAAKHGVSNEF